VCLSMQRGGGGGSVEGRKKGRIRNSLCLGGKADGNRGLSHFLFGELGPEKGQAITPRTGRGGREIKKKIPKQQSRGGVK